MKRIVKRWKQFRCWLDGGHVCMVRNGKFICMYCKVEKPL